MKNALPGAIFFNASISWRALETAKSAKAEAQKDLRELEDMKKIAAGKAFFMQSRNIKVNYLLLKEICPRRNNKVIIYFLIS